MTQKLSRTAQRRVARMVAHVKSIQKLCDRIDEGTLTKLVQRDSISSTIDGYSPGGTGENRSSGKGSGRPTESTATARNAEDWGFHSTSDWDELKDRLRNVEELLYNADNWLGEALSTVKELSRLETKLVGRQEGSEACELCGTNPAEKAGWCVPCYNDHWKHGKPDRMRWTLYKRQVKNSEGLVLVPDCPPPREGAKAIRGPWR